MLRRLYNLVFPVAFLVILPGYLRRMFRRGSYRQALGQRFGFYSPAVRERLAQGPARPWIQAVSVGEMLVALKLIAALRARAPDIALILSTTTTTGFALATERAGRNVEVVYTPIDSAGCVRRAFATLRPAQIIIVDGGLWPNLLWVARQQRLPVSLVNARLSPRSEARWRRFSFVSRRIMGLLDLVGVPETADVRRWETLGVPNGRVHLTGSVKFDATPPTNQFPGPTADSDRSASSAVAVPGPREFLQRLGVPPEAPVLLAGSTHPGEERAITEAFIRLRGRFPDLFLIIAPRHVERARAILADLADLPLRVATRSIPAPDMSNSAQVSRCDVLLLDTTGELRDWYASATIVFIGKSLHGIGGQNPMEAIATGKPVLFGPRMDNFRNLAAELLAIHGAVQVSDATGLELACAQLLADPAARARQAAAASQILTAHNGAAQRTADLLLAADGFRLARLPNLADNPPPIVASG